MAHHEQTVRIRETNRVHGYRCTCGAETSHVVVDSPLAELVMRDDAQRAAEDHQLVCDGDVTEFEEPRDPYGVN